MSKGSPPAPPDPIQTAAAQTQSNLTTADNNASLNRVNQYTPLGSSTYSINGYSDTGAPQYSQTVSLSPEQQQLYDQYTRGQQNQSNIALGMQGDVANSYGTPINTSGIPPINSTGGSTSGIQPGINSQSPGQQFDINYNQPIQNSVGGDYSAASKQAQDAAYNQEKLYLDPQYQQQQSTTDAKLANMGLSVGDQGYQAGQDQLAQSRERAYQAARDSAIGIGNQRQSDLFGQAVTAGNFANAAQQQGYGQAANNAGFRNSADAQAFAQAQARMQAGNAAQQQLYGQQYGNANLGNAASAQSMQQLFALRNQPLNEYNALMTGAQVQQPTFSSIPGVSQANTDVAGITNQGYQNQLAQYQQQQQGINNLFSLGGSLGSAAILASDRRLKRDVMRVGETMGGIPTYVFRYNGDNEQLYFGVMADEVMHIPGAAIMGDDGFYGVNYSVLK